MSKLFFSGLTTTLNKEVEVTSPYETVPTATSLTATATTKTWAAVAEKALKATELFNQSQQQNPQP